MKPPPNPTLEQVAELAGVSRATVSRVVREAHNVSPGTRRAVHAAIEEVGYVPNQAARSLVTRRTDTVALVVAEDQSRVFGEPFFAAIARGAAGALAARDRQMVLVMASGPEDQQRLARYLVRGHVDGVMLLSLRRDDPLPTSLHERGIPLSLAGPPPDGLPIPWVDADNRRGGRDATAHLLERGRRRVATIAGPIGMAVGQDRRRGWEQAHEEVGLAAPDSLAVPGDFSRASGEAGMRELLAREPDLDAVFAASDLMAAGALRVLDGAGLRVPDDVAVVGFDDSIVARSSSPALTTVRQPIAEMGRTLVELVLALIDGRDHPEHVLLATELVVRDSS